MTERQKIQTQTSFDRQYEITGQNVQGLIAPSGMRGSLSDEMGQTLVSFFLLIMYVCERENVDAQQELFYLLQVFLNYKQDGRFL